METTPIVYKGELYLFESVRPNYWNNTVANGLNGTAHFRFVHVLSGRKTPVFARGHGFGCAIVDEATEAVYVFGTHIVESGGTIVTVFVSRDGMQTWSNKTAIDLGPSKRRTWNTSVGKG